MPLHDYNCKNCSKDYTYFHNGSDDKTPKCPLCGSEGDPNERLIAKDTSFQLKGKNWAKDRYGK